LSGPVYFVTVQSIVVFFKVTSSTSFVVAGGIYVQSLVYVVLLLFEVVRSECADETVQ